VEHFKSFLKPFLGVLILAGLGALMNHGQTWVAKDQPETEDTRVQMSKAPEPGLEEDCVPKSSDRRIRLNQDKEANHENADECAIDP